MCLCQAPFNWPLFHEDLDSFFPVMSKSRFFSSNLYPIWFWWCCSFSFQPPLRCTIKDLFSIWFSVSIQDLNPLLQQDFIHEQYMTILHFCVMSPNSTSTKSSHFFFLSLQTFFSFDSSTLSNLTISGASVTKTGRPLWEGRMTDGH